MDRLGPLLGGGDGRSKAQVQRAARAVCLGTELIAVAAAAAVLLVQLRRGVPGKGGGGGLCDGPVCLAPGCMHALGGGDTRSGGDFPHVDPPGCRAQISAYVSTGAYLAEIEASVASAFDSLGLGGAAQGSASELFVFDIDETALSNIVYSHPSGAKAAKGAAPAAAPAAAELPPQRRTPGEWDDYVASRAGGSPPLEPTLRLYKALCAAGYSLAFVTGRGERVRAETARNLQEAGYGGLCPESRLAANATAGRAGRALMGPGGSGGAGGSSAGGAGDADECCYVALHLRPPGDTRLASVYKPWARRQLEARGYGLLGSIGDQFSDLNGEHSARKSFKLPNVMYYIL